MKPLLYPSVLIPWVVMIAAEFILFSRLIFHPGKTRYRAFESFVTVTLGSSLVCIGTAVFLTSREYFYVYYTSELLNAIAMLIAAYEQFAVMFMPRWVMPARGQVAFCVAVAAALFGSLTVAVLAPQLSPHTILALGRRFTVWENFGIFATLLIVMQFKGYYGVYLRPKCRAIMLGLLGVTGLGMAENFILAFSSNRIASALVGYLTTSLFCAVLLYWNHSFKCEELHLTITDEIPESVCLKKTPTSCGLTDSYCRSKIPASGE